MFLDGTQVDVLTLLADSEADPGRAAELAKVAAYPQAPTRKLKADESHIFNGKFQ